MFKKIWDFYLTSDKYNFLSISLTILISALIILIYILNLSRLPSKIPLFYSRAWGEEQLANLSQFIILPLMIILITMINLIISWQLHPSQIFLRRIVNLSTTLVALIILITSLKIVSIFI